MATTLPELTSAERTRLDGNLAAAIRYTLDLAVELRQAMRVLEAQEHEGTRPEVAQAVHRASEAEARLGLALAQVRRQAA